MLFSMKTIAVIGAGFAGLAAAYYLADRFAVTVFDQKGVGGGASGVSAGLLHPYPGEKGRKSWHSDEGMEETRKLLKIGEGEMGREVANYGGVIRVGRVEGEEDLGDGHVLIRRGVTVFTKLYLEGLFRACQKRGVELVIKKIGGLQDTDGYDYKVIAAGAGVREFAKLPVNFVKGQVLTCSLEQPLKKSICAKQYMAVTEDPYICHFGSTYERDFTSDAPCLETAVQLLKPRLPVLGCQAAIRVTNPAHYFPILEEIQPKVWVITALGSRGLLYHAYLGKKLAGLL
jgi:glycine/D-amino acid oxidase-like deaminating enzyme